MYGNLYKRKFGGIQTENDVSIQELSELASKRKREYRLTDKEKDVM